MNLGSRPAKAELSTLPERGTFYFALTIVEALVKGKSKVKGQKSKVKSAPGADGVPPSTLRDSKHF